MTTIAPKQGKLPIMLSTITLRRVKLHAISEEQCVSHIGDRLEAGEGGWVLTANLDHLRRFTWDKEYARVCEGATLVVADGMPLVWSSRIQGTPLPGRVAGSNLVLSLSAAVARRGRSVYLLGGMPGTAEAAVKALRQRCSGLKVAGTYCPPVGFENDPAQMNFIERRLSGARPDVIYVALGSPKTEWLISRLRDRLPNAWWLGVGISFSFLCGHIRRAPQWMQRIGLEWLHRLAQEPRRLAKRYLVQGIPFAGCLLAGAALRGAGGAIAKVRSPRSLREPIRPADPIDAGNNGTSSLGQQGRSSR